MRSSRTSKGKDSDFSTEWTAFKWDSRGFYVSSRTGPNGDTEWDWKYPQLPTPQQHQETPRTPVTDSFSISAPLSISTEADKYEQSFQSSERLPQTPADPLFTRNPDYQHARETGSSVLDAYNSSSVPTTKIDRESNLISSDFTEQSEGSRIPGSGNVSSFTSGCSPASSNLAGGSSQYERISSGPIYSSTAGTNTGRIYDASYILPSFNQMAIDGTSNQKINQIKIDPEHLPPIPKHIYKEPNSADFETLDPRYRVVENRIQKSFWKEGRVFMMLWTEPARPPPVDRNGGTRNGSHFSTTTLYGEPVYSEIRRFVVLLPGYGNNICAPVQTYSKQATLKPNLPDPQQHAIIYTGSRVPVEKSYVAEDGTIVRENLTKDPIRVLREQNDKEGELDPASRINYSKVYTVENFVRVLNIGMVHKNSMSSLLSNSIVHRRDLPQPPVRHPRRGKTGNETQETDGRKKGSSYRSKDNSSNRRKK